jgi:hypothetical protein
MSGCGRLSENKGSGEGRCRSEAMGERFGAAHRGAAKAYGVVEALVRWLPLMMLRRSAPVTTDASDAAVSSSSTRTGSLSRRLSRPDWNPRERLALDGQDASGRPPPARSHVGEALTVRN